MGVEDGEERDGGMKRGDGSVASAARPKKKKSNKNDSFFSLASAFFDPHHI